MQDCFRFVDVASPRKVDLQRRQRWGSGILVGKGCFWSSFVGLWLRPGFWVILDVRGRFIRGWCCWWVTCCTRVASRLSRGILFGCWRRHLWRLRHWEAPAYFGRQSASGQLRDFGSELLVELLQAASATDAVADLTQQVLVAPGAAWVSRLGLRLVAVLAEAAGLPVLEAAAVARHGGSRKAKVLCKGG